MRALKHKELLRCMTYFPVVVKRAHLAHLRAFIQSQHGGRPFDEVKCQTVWFILYIYV